MRYPCPKCNGTGASSVTPEGRVRCWNCNGNGADPAEYFRWSSHEKQDEGMARVIAPEHDQGRTDCATMEGSTPEQSDD